MRWLPWLLLAACSRTEPSLKTEAHEPLRLVTATPCEPGLLRREERRLAVDDLQIFVMTVRAPQRRGAVVLTHGAGSPSSALWDLKPSRFSLMRTLACAGFDAYALDVRGFGGSTRPEDPAQVRAQQVQAELAATIALAHKESGTLPDLLGWSWGSDVAAMFASQNISAVRRLILMAPVYDRRWPSRHVTTPKHQPLMKEAFQKYFDPQVDLAEPFADHLEQLFRFPPATLSDGPYADIYGDDAPLWNPRQITAPTLILLGDQDRASLVPNATQLFSDLERAAARRLVVVGNANHFFFRTRAYRQVYEQVVSFLTSDLDAPQGE